MRKICIAIIAVLALLSFASCGKKDVSSTDSVSSNESVIQKNTEFTIGNTTAKELSEKIPAVTLPDGYSVEMTENGLDSEQAYVSFKVKSGDGNEMEISVRSDLENKAAGMMIMWDFNKCSEETNTAFIEISKNTVIASWPDYSEEYMELVEKNFKFTYEYFNSISSKNVSKTANAVSGFISVGMSSNTAIVNVCYPDLVENV